MISFWYCNVSLTLGNGFFCHRFDEKKDLNILTDTKKSDAKFQVCDMKQIEGKQYRDTVRVGSVALNTVYLPDFLAHFLGFV